MFHFIKFFHFLSFEKSIKAFHLSLKFIATKIIIILTLASCINDKAPIVIKTPSYDEKMNDAFTKDRFYSDEGVPNEDDYLKKFSLLQDNPDTFNFSTIPSEYPKGTMYFERMVKYDKNFDGIIAENEFESLAKTLTPEEAQTIKYLYESRLDDLSNAVKKSFLAFSKDKASGIENSLDANYEPYISFSEKVRNSWTHEPERGSKKIFINSFPYDKQPLRADDILILSGGEITENRIYPLLTRINFMRYAKSRGYRFSHFDGNMSAFDEKNRGRKRHSKWARIYLILDALYDEKNKVVVWLDDDGIVNSNPRKLDMIIRYLNAYPTKDLIMAQDEAEKAYLNSGIMIVRNTQVTKEFFAEVIKVGEENRCWMNKSKEVTKGTLMDCNESNECLHEQQSIYELYAAQKRMCFDQNSENWNVKDFPRQTSRNWKNHIEVVLQYDPINKLNMNFFIDEKSDYLTYSDKNYKINSVTYSSKNKPFFVQCPEKDRKHYKIASMMLFFQLFNDKEDLFNIISAYYPYMTRAKIMKDILELE